MRMMSPAAHRTADRFTARMFRGLWVPAMLSSLGWALSDMADAVVVGQRLGAVGLAAIGLILPVYMINCMFAHGLGLGGSVRYSRLLSQGKTQEAADSFHGVLALALLFSVTTVGAALLAAAAIFGAVNAPAAVRASAATRQLPIYCVERDQKVCSISFDAAWGADNTQKILDVLADYGVKCTFFVVGNWADQYPEQAKAIVESGNELMNHSNAHDHYNSLTADRIIADVNTCNDKIEALTGVRPTLIRCPFGEYDDHVISAIRSIGMEPIQWDVERYHIA